MSEFKLAKNKNVVKMFRRDNTILIYIIMVAIAIGIVFASFFAFYQNQQNSDLIQPGVFIKGTNVSGLTKEEACTLVRNNLKGKMNENIVLTYKNYNYNVAIEQIEAEFDIEASVDFAYNIARHGTLSQNVKDYISVLMIHIDIDPILKYNEEALREYILDIETKLPDQLEQSSYYLEDDDELVITNGKNGAGIFVDDLQKTILSALQDISYSNRYIEIPTYVKYPEAIDVNAIHEDIFVEPQNAYYTTDPYMVYPHVVGVDFNPEKVQDYINEHPDYEDYKIELKLTKPDVLTDDIGMEAFPHKLATFSTKYPNNPNRTTNLRLASNKINGTVVMPGDVFSFNKVVGKRTEAAGYKNAAIFQDGGVTDGLAGGICQISTTLYNAALYADMTITARRNHMFIPSYVDGGRDATVVWGSTDFRFRNDRDYPIKIESSVSNGVATVSIYGFHRDNEYDISIETKKIQTIKGKIPGSVWDSWRVYKKDGQVVKREKLYRDTYSAQNK